MGNVAAWEEIVKLNIRVHELESIFQHYHINKQDGTDTCKRCGLDLRDGIHKRSQP